MRVLVTGADGLLGSHLVRELLDGGFTVAALVQEGTDAPTLRGLPVEAFPGDLTGEESGLEAAVSGCRAVFHCAAVTDLWADPRLVWSVNHSGTGKVVDACISEGVERLVHVGSASSFAFGPAESPGDESGEFPAEYRGMAYMESKHRAMKLVLDSAGKGDIDALVLAPTFLLGAYDYRPSGGELIRQFIKRGLKSVSPGGRNFACARDVAAAAVSALEKGRTGQAYIAGGANLGYLDFFRKVAAAAGVEPPVRVLPRPLVLAAGAMGSAAGKISGRKVAINLRMAKIACYDTFYSSARAIEELGMPTTPIEKAIDESLGSLEEYGHI